MKQYCERVVLTSLLLVGIVHSFPDVDSSGSKNAKPENVLEQIVFVVSGTWDVSADPDFDPEAGGPNCGKDNGSVIATLLLRHQLNIAFLFDHVLYLHNGYRT